MNTRFIRSCLEPFAIVVCGIFFAVHILMIVATNLPSSPLTQHYARTISWYTYPYFTQRWTFFAPQPITKTMTLIARAEYPENGKMSFTDWTDVESPLVNEVRKARFAPMSLVLLGLSNSLMQYMNSVSKDKSTVVKDITDPSRLVVRPIVPPTVAPVECEYLTRTAAASLKAQFPNADFTRIQIGVTAHDVPKFSHRFEKDDESNVSMTLVEWQAFPKVDNFRGGIRPW